jgi:hypothetical protein
LALPWSNLLLGWIEEFQIEDDYRRYATWALRITSIAGILSRQHCPPIRIGDLDIAQAGKVIKTAQILAHPSKERKSGDFTESDPDLSGASLIDGRRRHRLYFRAHAWPIRGAYAVEDALDGWRFRRPKEHDHPPRAGQRLPLDLHLRRQ